MMVTCPKCGFDQPQDQYCANCGLNIERYKPPKSQSLKKLAKNLGVQIVVVAILIGGIAFWVKRARYQEIQERINFLTSTKSSRIIERTPKKNSLKKSTLTEVPPLATPKKEATPNTEENAKSELSTTTASKTPPQVKGVTVHYIEAKAEFMNALYEMGQEAGQLIQFGEYTAGYVPSIKALFAQTKDFESLKTVNQELAQPNSSLQWFAGPDESSEIGLTIHMRWDSLQVDEFQGEIEVLRSLIDQEDQPSKQSFQEGMTLSNHTGFFMAGLLPRRELNEEEEEIYKDTILKVLSSPEFQNEESEFIILFDFESNAGQ